MRALIEKYKILLLAIVAVWILWWLAFSKTWDEYSMSVDAKESLLKAETADEQIKILEIQKEKIQSRLIRYAADSLKNKEMILQGISDFCKNTNVILREFPSEGTSLKGDYKIETNKIVAEGSYHNLLKLVHYIEYNTTVGKISSVSFQKIRDHKLQRDILLVNMYIQNFSKI